MDKGWIEVRDPDIESGQGKRCRLQVLRGFQQWWPLPWGATEVQSVSAEARDTEDFIHRELNGKDTHIESNKDGFFSL